MATLKLAMKETPDSKAERLSGNVIMDDRKQVPVVDCPKDFGSREYYYSDWGKAQPTDGEQNAAYHLLPYHCLDVAAVADQWWDSSAAIRTSFCRVTGVSQSQTKAWVLFFIALHDLGKLDVRFQLKVPEALKILWPDFGEDDANSERGYYHGPQGYLAFRKQISRKLGFDLDSAKDWLAAVCGHHGDLQMSGQWKAPDAEEWVIERDEEARLAWINTLVDLFLRPAQIDYRAPLPPIQSHTEQKPANIGGQSGKGAL